MQLDIISGALDFISKTHLNPVSSTLDFISGALEFMIPSTHGFNVSTLGLIFKCTSAQYSM